MIRSMYKATAGVAAALMLIGVTSSVYGFTGSYSALTRSSREVQLTGRVICTNCTLDEARKTQPKYSNHLYRLMLGQQPVIMEVYQTTNATLVESPDDATHPSTGEGNSCFRSPARTTCEKTSRSWVP